MSNFITIALNLALKNLQKCHLNMVKEMTVSLVTVTRHQMGYTSVSKTLLNKALLTHKLLITLFIIILSVDIYMYIKILGTEASVEIYIYRERKESLIYMLVCV